MKKMLSAIIAGAMVFSQGIPGFAKSTEDLTKVLSQIKDRIPDTEGFKDFDANSQEENGQKVYSFEWEKSGEENYESLRVTVSAGGIITNYNYYNDSFYDRDNDTPTMNRLSADEALEKTKELIKKLNPDIYPSLVIEKQTQTESLYDNEYSFSVYRKENGIPVHENNGYVMVNRDASKLMSFYIDYDENLTFPELTGAMNVDGAWQSFGENAGMELEYRTEYNDSKRTAVLVYAPKLDYNQYIDAFTGKVESIYYRYNYSNDGMGGGDSVMAKAEMAADTENSGLTEREFQEIEKVSGLISEEEAEKLIRENTSLDFHSGLELQSINCFKRKGDDKEDYYYMMRFEINKPGNYEYASATVDAKTGELISWSGDYEYDRNAKTLEGDELKSTAEAILEKVAPKHFGENSAKDFKNEKEIYTDNGVTYTRYVNGIKFDEDGIYVMINPKNKKLVSYRLNCSDIKFPSPDGIISSGDAAKKLSEQAELTLMYIPTVSDPDNKEIKTVDTVKVGYRLQDPYECALDAKTGKLKRENNSEDNVPEYSDISGHYAEKAIKELAKYGIGFESGEFKPDTIITQEEYAALLMSAFVNRSPIILRRNSEDVLNCYKRAVNKGIITDKDGEPSDSLTREKAAVFMVRAMGGEKYAQIPGIFNSLFPDVKNNVGYISILAGLKVFNGDENGNFNPDKMLTRAEAMTAIYNYLTR